MAGQQHLIDIKLFRKGTFNDNVLTFVLQQQSKVVKYI